MDKLLAQAWKPIPETFEILYFKTMRQGVFQEKFHRKHLLEALSLNKSDPSSVKQTLAEEKEWLRGNLDRIRKEALDGKRSFNRIFKRGDVIRWDFATAKDEELLTLETPFDTTYLQSYDPVSKAFKGLYLEHRYGKTADLYDDPRRRMHVDEAWDWGRFPVGLGILLRMSTAKTDGKERPIPSKEGDFQIDAEKFELLRQGRHPKLLITVREVQIDEKVCDQFTISLRSMPKPIVELTCRKNNYELVPLVKAFNPQSGEVVATTSASEFQTQGQTAYPRVVRSTKKANTGDGEMFENIIIEKLNSPAKISSEDLSFATAVPKDYLYTDSRPDTPVFLQGRGPVPQKSSLKADPSKRSGIWYSIIIFNILFAGVLLVFVLVRSRKKEKTM